ncbi:MAG: calcium-binding protein [Tepidisphaeraceae bacterium]
MIETLESRRLLSASLSNGVLTVLGTASADNIQISQSAANLTLSDNGVITTYELSTVQFIVVKGGDGADTIILSNKNVTIPGKIEGGRGNDLLSGGKANDSILGGGGDDYMFGGDGNDILDGNTQSDDFLGGLGRDTASYFHRTANVTVGLGNFADDGEIGEGDNVRTDIEVVYGGAGNDTISTTSGKAVRFYGFAGNDTLIGGSGADLFDGGAGADSLTGNGGDDLLFANDGVADILSGGSGADTAESDPLDTVTGVP